MSIDLTRFHALFFSESLESLEAAEQNLMAWERGARDADTVGALFRAVHSIKGSAGSLGFEDIGRFAHDLENLLDLMRGGRYGEGSDDIDLLLAGLDVLRAMLLAMQQGREPVSAGRVEAMRSRLADQARLADPTPAPAVARPAATGPAPSEAQPSEWRITLEPLEGFASGGHEARRYLAILGELGQVQDVETLVGAHGEGFRLRLRTLESTARIREEFAWVEDVAHLRIEPAEQAPAPEADVVAAAGGLRVGVEAERLDGLLDLIGEFVGNQASMSGALRAHAQGRLDSEAFAREMAGCAALFERHVGRLYDTVMAIRLVPASMLLRPFERTVRDLARRLGKQVRLVTVGDDEPLDMSLVEKLGEPLSHLVRNALDHGIEQPQARIAAGKPAEGVLSLQARLDGSFFTVTVADDGAGMDPERVRRRAVERGWAAADETRPAQQWLEYVFRPGFSTADAVSDVSGRGVGLDAVTASVARLGGTVAVSNVRGSGTRFTLRFPLSLVIVDALLVRSGGARYALPGSDVKQCLALRQAQLAPGGGQGLLRLAGHHDGQPVLLAVDDLSAFLGQPPSGQDAGDSGGPRAGGVDTAALLVVESGGRALALRVDEVIDRSRIVVKSLERHFVAVPCLSGLTAMSDGQWVPVLDVGALVAAGARRQAAALA